MAIHPASGGEQEKLQRMGHRQATRPRWPTPTLRGDSAGLGRCLAPYGGMGQVYQATDAKLRSGAGPSESPAPSPLRRSDDSHDPLAGSTGSA